MRIRRFENGLLLFSVFLIIFWFYLDNSNRKNIIKKSKYTIATITSKWHTKKEFRSFGVDYTYSVNGKTFTYSISKDLKQGEKYLLIYDSLKPNNCVLFDIYHISNNIHTPINGWSYKQVPLVIDSIEIKKYVDSF